MQNTKPPHILYVEDDRDLALLVKERLAQSGIIADLAYDGEAALSQLRKEVYDLLAVDQTLPGLDGLGVLLAIAALGPLPPTVMVTGTGNERIAVQTMKLGMDDYIIKDLDGGWLDLLPGVIERVLDHRRMAEEKKAAEAALREREQQLWNANAQYRHLFDNNLDAVLLTSPDGTICDANPTACAMLGMSKEEICHARRAGILDNTDRRVSALLEERERLGKINCEMTWIRKDGSKFPVEISSVILESENDSVRSFVIARDITARKRAEKTLQAIKYSIDIVSDAAFWTDSQGRFTYVNESACQSVGYSSDELTQMWIWDVNPLATPTRWKEVWGRLRKHGKQRFESIHRRKDGSEFPVEVVSTYVCFAEQEYTCGFARDITDRRRAEQEKLEMERRLLHAQKLESLGILAGGIAHDFNNILAGIMGYADLAKARLPEWEPAREDLDIIKKSVQRAADLTRQMLAYSGKGKFVVEAVNLSRMVEDTQKMLEVTLSKKAVVKYNLSCDLPSIQADASQIHQVLLNLVINASESLGDNSGAIAIVTDAIQLRKADCAAINGGSELREGLYVRLEVKDTGCGMDRETLGKIFDPFFTTKFTGRGLGLAAVHGIVRGHKGAIQVTSELGKGTTFQIYFPASSHPLPAAQDESAAISWRGSGTVLIVDDDKAIRISAQRMLERAGFSSLTASGGREAIRLFRQHQHEVRCVLLD